MATGRGLGVARPRALRWGWRQSTYLGLAPFLVALTTFGRAAQNIGQTTYPLEGHELLGIGNGALGTMTAVGGLAGVAIAATLGAKVTPANAFRMLAIGQAMVLAAFIAFAIPGGGVPTLWLGAILVWGGGGLVFPATMTAVGTGGAANRSRSMAVYAVGLSIGLSGGPLVEAGVLHVLSESLRTTFAVLAPLPVVATGLSIIGAVVQDRRSQHHGTWEDHGEMAVLMADGGPGELPPAETRTPAPRARSGLMHLPPYRLALAVLLTYEAPYVAVVAFGGLLATRADGASSSGAEIGFAAFYTVSLLVRLLVVRLSPIRPLRAALIASVLVTAGGAAVLGTAHGFAAFVVGMVLLGAPHGLTFPLAGSIVAEHVDKETLGRANARLMASTDMAAVVVPLLCGWLAAAVGYRSTFLFVELPVVAVGTMLAIELVRLRRWVPDPRARVDAVGSD